MWGYICSSIYDTSIILLFLRIMPLRVNFLCTFSQSRSKEAILAYLHMSLDLKFLLTMLIRAIIFWNLRKNPWDNCSFFKALRMILLDYNCCCILNSTCAKVAAFLMWFLNLCLTFRCLFIITFYFMINFRAIKLAACLNLRYSFASFEFACALRQIMPSIIFLSNNWTDFWRRLNLRYFSTMTDLLWRKSSHYVSFYCLISLVFFVWINCLSLLHSWFSMLIFSLER